MWRLRHARPKHAQQAAGGPEPEHNRQPKHQTNQTRMRGRKDERKEGEKEELCSKGGALIWMKFARSRELFRCNVLSCQIQSNKKPKAKQASDEGRAGKSEETNTKQGKERIKPNKHPIKAEPAQAKSQTPNNQKQEPSQTSIRSRQSQHK